MESKVAIIYMTKAPTTDSMPERDRPVDCVGIESAPLKIMATALKSELLALKALSALVDHGWVCVPKIPTNDMIEAAWADALAENAFGVWKAMVRVLEGEN